LGGFGIYVVNPELYRSAIDSFMPSLNPTITNTISPAKTSAIPSLTNISNTSTLDILSTPTVTKTIEPTSTNTPEPSPTFTYTSLPTPLAGAEQIAFASSRSGAVEIWIMNIDGSGLKQITNIPEGACQPRWAPDGKRLVFISPCKNNKIRNFGANLFIINADGTDLAPLPNAPGGDYDPSWSPDGTKIAFTSLRNGGVPGIYILNLSDNTVKSLVEDETRAISQPAWSPDGSEIAYVNSDNRIWVMDINGENRRSLIIGEWDYVTNEPAWSPDGSVVIFSRSDFSDTSGSTRLMALPYNQTGAIPVDVPNSQLVSDSSYSFDGYWLLFTSWYSGFHDIYIMRVNGVDRMPIEDDPAYDFDPAWRPISSNLP